MVSCSWTKLLLDSSAKPTPFDDPNLSDAIEDGRLRLPTNRNAQGVAADFLREVYQHLEKKLIKQMGASTFKSTPMDCWLTVPAVWSDQAQNATKAAAMMAGFGSRRDDTISIITEPEAAAVAVLKSTARPDAINPPAPGDNILICDCGGGTVDITTYTILQTSPSPVFEELCVGNGGKCGSTSIDRNLEQLMRERFGMAYDEIDMRRKGPGSRFMSSWESVKLSFGDTSDDRVQEIGPLNMRNVPESPWYNAVESMVLLTRYDGFLVCPRSRSII